MKSSFYARAQLRSKALLEPYGESLRHVRRVRSGDPVIPTPSRSQAMLEGLIVGSIGYLFDPEQEQDPERSKLVPLRIWVGEREYTMRARSEGLASSLSRLVPLFNSARDKVLNGIPGLRYSDLMLEASSNRLPVSAILRSGFSSRNGMPGALKAR